MGSITPRWLLRLLPWAEVEAGTYRVNRVRVIGAEPGRVDARMEGEVLRVDPPTLRSIPLLRSLDAPTLERLSSAFQSEEVPAGSLIVGQGAVSDRFFVIARGKVEVWLPSALGGRRSLALLREGDYFGEMALLHDEPRTANVEALVPTVLLSLPRAEFVALLSSPEIRARLEEVAAERSEGLREATARVMLGLEGEPVVVHTYVDYDPDPREYALQVIQATMQLDTKISDLYASPHDQLQQLSRLAVEAAQERQEWEILNNPSFGLLHNVAPAMRITTRSGPPTPDDLDELLSVVWKHPAYFVAHPRTIAAFARECTRRGVPPPTMSLFGCPFLTWRGVPLVPVDKMEIDRSRGVPRSSILLMRVGEELRGVVGLRQSSIGDTEVPSLAIRYNGVNERGIANYLLSLYFSVAVLTDDAIGMLEDVEVSRYHSYEV